MSYRSRRSDSLQSYPCGVERSAFPGPTLRLRSFNRTLVVLKESARAGRRAWRYAFNRTLVVLKGVPVTRDCSSDAAFNRTLVVLKVRR